MPHVNHYRYVIAGIEYLVTGEHYCDDRALHTPHIYPWGPEQRATLCPGNQPNDLIWLQAKPYAVEIVPIR